MAEAKAKAEERKLEQAQDKAAKADEEARKAQVKAAEARAELDAVAGRKPVWNVATMGPVPDDRDGVYEVVLPADGLPATDPNGNVIGGEDGNTAKGDSAS